LPPKRTAVLLAAIVSLAYGLWVMYSGAQVAVDTPTYSRWADVLIGLHFNVSSYLDQQQFVAPPLLYLLWVMVVAMMKTLLGSSWMTGILVLNWIALSIGAFAIIETVRKLTQSGASMLLVTGLLLVSGDLLIFVPYVLSDLLFWVLSAGVLTCGALLAAREGDRRRSREGDRRRSQMPLIAAGSALVVTALLCRPVALPLLLFWLISVTALSLKPLFNRFGTPLLVSGLIVAFIAILAHAYVLQNPSSWPIGPLPAMLGLVRDEYRVGMFVHQASPPMLVTPASDMLGFVRITLEKLIFFITPWLPHYSSVHAVINLLFFLPLYGFAIAAISNLRRLAESQQRAVVVLALFVLLMSVFHAMLLIDSDHRYRLPLLPALLMLAAIGLESVRRPRTIASIARGK
jgi:hypothetical protein